MRNSRVYFRRGIFRTKQTTWTNEPCRPGKICCLPDKIMWQENLGYAFAWGWSAQSSVVRATHYFFLVYLSWCPILFLVLFRFRAKVNFHLSLDQRKDRNTSLLNEWMGLYEWVHKYCRGIFNKIDSDWVTVLKIITKASTAPFVSLHRKHPPEMGTHIYRQ